MSFSEKNRLVDRYDRHLNYLRISVTDRCNLSCLYCAPRRGGEIPPKLNHEEVLRYEEILRLVRIGAELGISKIRVTGGEPLVRKDLLTFIRELSGIGGIKEISLTTNGVLLMKHLEGLKETGIRRLNISLDTLIPEKFARITGQNSFDKVWEAIMAAHALGFSPIKINAVAMKGINDDEFIDLARLSLKYPFHIRFIEHMPIGDSASAGGRISADEIIQRISSVGKLISVEQESLDGPAVRYRYENAPGEIGLIQPMSHHFCGQCNRLRLTARGRLRPCLLHDREIDLKSLLREGATDMELAKGFLEAVLFKPLRHHLAEKGERVNGRMSAIGG